MILMELILSGINQERERILKENITHFHSGDMIPYQNNCNRLAGIAFVKELLLK